MPKFIHLRNHTQYSLSEGAIKITELVNLAVDNKMPAVAITDTANLFGIMEFSKACSSNGVQPIIGSEISVEGSKLLIYAANDEGFANLLKIVSHSYLASDSPHEASIDLVHLEKLSAGILCLTGGVEGQLAKYLSSNETHNAEEYLNRLMQIFPQRLYIEINRHGLPEESKVEDKLIDAAYKNKLPLIATNNCFFADEEMYEAHDALLCIAQGKVVADPNRRKLNPEFRFKSQDEMIQLFLDIPEAIQNTVEFAKRCSVKAEGRKPMLPDFPSKDDRKADAELRYQAHEGLKFRLNEIPEEYAARLEFELDVIIKMDFPGYFLIVSDFIKWAKNQGIPVGPGRGSGAGSLVAWALQITDVDPLKFGLLFERFLNPDRISMPDFDIDFCQERRDEVIDYVRKKYGNDRVAQIITFGKLQARAVLRDVGRVLQIPYGQVDSIAKMIPFNPVDPVTLAKAIEMDSELQRMRDEDELIGKLINISLKLEGLNRHASTHAAGILISDRPLENIVPLYRDPRSEIPVSQYSMKDAEIAGLVKFDFLGLRTLTLVNKAVKFIEEKGVHLDLLNLPLDKKEVFEMLSKGETVGVFQLDSALVRDAIRKMKPDRFEDIVALTSLCRPGPMENIPTYVARKNGKEKMLFPHEKLSGLLSETYGILVYQEQVMQAAQLLAGYSLGAADLLRRAMGKKIKAEMDEQREIFSKGAASEGIGKNHAKEIFDLIAKFAGYGFNKSHAVAYSLIAYQTAYLRCFYPVEFFAACMNLDIGDTDKLSFYKNEAQQQGIKILTPDVNTSDAYFRPIDGKISYALGAIKGVGIEATKLMIEERNSGGAFKDVFDLARRCDVRVINKKHLEGLTKAGAFDNLHKNRRQIFESAEIISRYNNAEQRNKESNQISLFGEAEIIASSTPPLPIVPDWDDAEKLQMEYEAFGFYLSDHPLQAYAGVLTKMGVLASTQIEEKVHGNARIMVAGVVATTKLRSGKKGRFGFAKLSDAHGVFEIVMYDDNLITNSAALLASNEPLLVTADARKDEGGVRIIAERIESLRKVVDKNSARFMTIEMLNFNVPSQQWLDVFSEILRNHEFKEGDLYKTKIRLTVTEGDRDVIIELPGNYAVNDNVKNSIIQSSEVKMA